MRFPAWIKGTVLLAAMFAAGVATGVTYERRRAAPHESAVVSAHDAVHHLVRELDLDENQQRAIAEILSRHQGEIDAAWHAMQPHMRAALDSTSKEILGVLRPEQAVKYQRMVQTLHPASHH